LNLYRELRKLPDDQHVPFLLERGFDQEGAENFARSYQVTRAEIKERLNAPVFSQSEAFKDIHERVEKLRAIRYGISLQRNDRNNRGARPMVPPHEKGEE
jgi:hypothetical protein